MNSKLLMLKYPAALAVAVALTSCGSSSDSTPSTGTPAQALITVPGVTSAVTFSFDLGAVDPATGVYYVTDRTNKAIDFIQLNGNLNGATTGQFKGPTYAGCNSGGTAGGSATRPFVPMPGCLNITTTPNVGLPSVTLVTNNDLDGPDGLDIVGGALYVGDVNALWVLNKNTGATVAKVVIANSGLPGVGVGGGQGFRSDEGCYDPINHLYATALTGDPSNPFYTILDTTGVDGAVPGTPKIIARVLMNGPDNAPAAGLEACAFDPVLGGGFMYLNNDGSTANPNGEMDGIPIADLIALRTAFVATPITAVFAGSPVGPFNNFGAAGTAAATCALGAGGACGAVAPKIFPLPALCDPTGLALGPGTDVGAMCRPGTIGHSLDFVILNRTTGALVANVTGAGGGDQITYDAGSNRWYLANSRATATTLSCGAGTAVTCPLTPQIGVVDGTSHTVVGKLASGNNAHSIAVGMGLIVSPFTTSSAAGGGQTFSNGGLVIYPTF